MNKDFVVDELIRLIEKGNAHASFEEAVDGVSPSLLTEIPAGLPYSIWQLVEHIRIAQWDIVEFCTDSDHQSPKWPEGYWPENVVTVEQWKSALRQIKEDRSRFFDLLKDTDRDLSASFAHGDGQTLFREALLIADHNSYHTGEIIVIRRLLKDWKS